ncbi:hypothetical protein M569_11581, partial [Genlisea aurea]
MESKHLLVGVGIGMGVGIGLAFGKRDFAGDRISPQRMEQEMLSLVVDGRDSDVTFDRFPYFLSEQTRALLTSAAFVHLRKGDLGRHTRNLSPASQTILLSAPTEMYQQMLAKALAHYFDAKLLLLDVTNFSLKMQSKYGFSKVTSFRRSISETAIDWMSDLPASFLVNQPMKERKGPLHRRASEVDLVSRYVFLFYASMRKNVSSSESMNDLASMSKNHVSGLFGSSNWCFDDHLLVETLHKVISKVSQLGPVVLYLRDVEKILSRSRRTFALFRKMLKRISGSVLILGSKIVDPEEDYRSVDERTSCLFPYNVEIKLPEDDDNRLLVSWKSQLEEDLRMVQYQDSRNHILEVLAANDLDCNDLGSISLADTIAISDYAEEIMVSAISHHLTTVEEPVYRNGKLVISTA